MKKKRVLVWFRQDLRVHDNEALTDALRAGDEVILAYIFDKRIFQGKTRFGFPKTGFFRQKFIVDSVVELRRIIRSMGSELIVRVGYPEEELYRLAAHYHTSWVFCNRERTAEEVKVQDALEKNLWEIGQEIVYSRGKMLYYTQDLPFPVSHTPDTFGQFRKEVEKVIPVREPLPVPLDLKPVSQPIDPGNIPNLSDLSTDLVQSVVQSENYFFKGGEEVGLKMLEEYFSLESNFEKYQSDKDGFGQSSALSPWLSQGCLSPKTIYRKLDSIGEKTKYKKAVQALKVQLIFRDYLRLLGKKYENRIFLFSGMNGQSLPDLTVNHQLFDLWKNGETGVPIIDANMRQLKKTGFLSNKGRQLTAAFLVHDLKVNWQLGAEYFESQLIDYDPMSNWVNWNIVSGLTNDQKEVSKLNYLAQAKKHDPKGAFLKRWIPEIAKVPAEKIHALEMLTEAEQNLCSLKIGVDYPFPLVTLANQY